MLVVIALGGNALARRGEPSDLDTQRRHAAAAAASIAVVAEQHDVVVTHGNGPQVGLLALHDTGSPLDVLDAQTEGMIGYMLEQELGRHLEPGSVATLLTQVVVDADDPAFGNPTKPIGLEGARRLVASPEPRAIVELSTIRLLVNAGVTVICGGGGGIPVVRDRIGGLHGVEAVIDKDLFASLLGTSLAADALLLLTDVPAVYEGFGTPEARPVREIDCEGLRRLSLPSGSMGPKAEAACRFVEGGGQVAVIGALEDAFGVLGGRSGTRVRVRVH